MQALESFGHVRLVAGAEAAGVLAQFDPDVVIIDDREEGHLDLLADIDSYPAAPVRILLSAHGAGSALPAGVAVLPKPVDPPAAQAMCTLALRCAVAQRAALERGDQTQRLRGLAVEPLPSSTRAATSSATKVS